jgi:long-chain acyl-CoA synthetase
MSTAITLEQAKTLAGLFRERVARTPANPAYTYFDKASESWLSLTWQETARQVAQWQAALRRDGLQPGQRVAVMLRNRWEWVVFDQAALGLGLVTVPLYMDDRPDNIGYILRATESQLLMVDNERQRRRIEDALSALPDLRVVNLEQPGDWLPARFDADFYTHPGNTDDLASIVYTSGTTGKPKGVMLSHRNILFNVLACGNATGFREEDVFLSFLPLSHTLERSGGYYLPMWIGASVAYARSIQQLAADFITIRPTVLASVPRIYEQVFAKIHAQLAQKSPLQRWIFHLAVNTGWQRFLHRQGRGGWHPSFLLWPFFANKVADPILSKLGGRLRLAVCGGAALPPPVARLFIGLGLELLQGYGLTETSPVIAVNLPQGWGSNIPESVGPPLPGVEVKLGDNGELLTRSPSVMLGYWQNPEATRAMIDADGWLHTGDRARIDSYGHIHLIGRIKDIIVMSNGEKLPPNDMEMAIAAEPLFSQAMILGEAKPYLAALLVLNQEEWQKLAESLQLDPADAASLRDRRVEKTIQAKLAWLLREFPGYAHIRRFTLLLEAWTIENGLLTPTMKIKRSVVLSRYAKEIEQMYKGYLAE